MRIAFSCLMRSTVPAAATAVMIGNATAQARARRIWFDSFIIPRQENRPGPRPGRSNICGVSVAAGAEQLEQHHKQVDKVEVEAQGTHNRFLAGDFGAVALVVHLPDLL